MTRYRPTRAEIDLDAIRHNVRALGAKLAPGVERLAVVKANAYGHGDIEVSRAALEAGATRLGVALVEEGLRLREAGISAPILLLVDPPPDAAKEIVANELTPTLYRRDSSEALDEAAQAAGTVLNVHVCVDTGMHREGVPYDDASEVIGYIDSLPGLEIEGVWSHFAAADEREHPDTQRQLELFNALCARIDVPIKHVANSPASIASDSTHFDLVRMGIAMYGLYPAMWQRPDVDLRPALRLVSAVSHVRRVPAGEGVSYGLTYRPDLDTRIANVPIGYGDGYARSLSNLGEVLIGGKRRPIAGTVTMDTIMVDCGEDEVEVGAEVVLIGTQGGDEITADEIADKLRTINYEVVTRIGPRVPRVYTT